MAARTLEKMRRAQSLLRECHGWLVQNDELLLAVELCAIEGSLALLFENRGLSSSPSPGIQEKELPRLQPLSNSQKRRNRRRAYNDYRRPHPINRGETETSTSRAGGGQNIHAQATASTARGTTRVSNSPDADLETPRVQAAVTGTSPPEGVLLDFNNDVEFVQFPPSMVAGMEAAQTTNLESKRKQRLSERPAARCSDGPAPGVSVPVDGDDGSFHQTTAAAAHAASAGLDTPVSSHRSPAVVKEGVVSVTSQPPLPGSPVSGSLEGGSHVSQTNQWAQEITEATLIDLDDDLAVILPGETDADTHQE
ncbi:unnamed protein product [Penicillium nalgiovense]|uniref:Uncharacterized protein n=1 Tax=Penicillium nalgiovense TaxID=60175 RepID=A0A9W4ICX3_PENNA|nr:unnamed protein product [Penicillium nalgiovense]CAG8042033.1 unnamed protein product [Penicillium nalgiovense]CAG8076465.1 unnamed protein product [Penicillium nalgiovense]CAG8092700.1 unnamed protein product [Penicillium nalgiovense]CAG8098539.1 unnamed protein product [Penicillium nalgiovense]